MGFILESDAARDLIAQDLENEKVVQPYLVGHDLNQTPDSGASRWIVNFHDWDLSVARRFPTALEIVERLVRPEREGRNRAAHARRWWRFADYRLGMEEAISGLDQCVVITLHAHAVMPVMVPTGQVFSHALGVFASDDPGLLALLSSAPHYWWAIDRASTMKGDLRYTPTDVFETLVRPLLTNALRSAGARLNTYRSELMQRRGIGLTDTYGLVHNPSCVDSEIAELRAIHEEIDRATVSAYGWHDLLDETGQTSPTDPTHETFPLDHGFHETDQGTRYTIGLLARTEIIDRLRQSNHQAYADEVFLGLHKKPKTYVDMPSPSAEARRKKQSRSWPPPDSMTAGCSHPMTLFSDN
ncbi:type IIL restriction-modification enzyme MmeI [Streptomyces kaempferi]